MSSPGMWQPAFGANSPFPGTLPRGTLPVNSFNPPVGPVVTILSSRPGFTMPSPVPGVTISSSSPPTGPEKERSVRDAVCRWCGQSQLATYSHDCFLYCKLWSFLPCHSTRVCTTSLWRHWHTPWPGLHREAKDNGNTWWHCQLGLDKNLPTFPFLVESVSSWLVHSDRQSITQTRKTL